MVKKVRLYVSPDFKFELEMKRLEAERKENRKIPLPEFTNRINIIPKVFDSSGWKTSKRKKNEWVF